MSRFNSGRIPARCFHVAIVAVVESITSVSAATVELDEIVVTARQREVAVQEAPIAVSAVSGSSFEKSNVSRLDNFNAFVPGLVVAKNDGAGRIVTIRGLGWETAQNLATQPSVLSYRDGFYLANPLSMGIDLNDIERVEVFRGPQGTEFGQGTTGGAINIVSKKPQLRKNSAAISLAFGTFNTVKARGVFNTALGEASALRASLQWLNRDGFAEIRGGAFDGYELDNADAVSARLAFKTELSESWSMMLRTDIYRSDQNAAAQKNIDDPNPDPRELTQDFPGIFELDNSNVALTVQWQTDSGLNFKSLTGWQDLSKRQSVDGDRLTESIVNIDRLGFFAPDNWDVLTFWDNDSRAFSQEISASFSGNELDWTAGVYYLGHENFNDFLEATGAAPFADSVTALANPGPTTLPPFASVLNFNETRTVRRKDKAVYGQLTVRTSDRLALTGGVRFQEEEQRDFGQQFFGLFGGFDRTIRNSKLTWKAGFDFQATSNHLVYGLVSTGWKNGGTNPGAISNGAMFLTPGFSPETVTAFELGSRYQLADDSFRLNVTAFFYDHRHMQFNFEDPVPFAGGTGTIPRLEEYGVEAEFSWQLSDAWRIDGMFAWQDGKVLSNVFALDPVGFRESLAPGLGLFTTAGFDARLALLAQTNLAGNKPAKQPETVSRLVLSNEKELQGGMASTRLEWLNRGKMQSRVYNHPVFDSIPSYSVVNLHLGYDIAGRPIDISLTASNLFDKAGINNTFNNPFGIWSTSNEYIPPREVIVALRVDWE